MRKLIGSAVLIAGVGVLGYVGTTQHAQRMQSSIAARTDAVVRTAPHAMQTQVSGRDVVVTGLATDQTELAVLQATFDGIEGVRTVDMSGVTTLPTAAPFALTATRDVDGNTALSGAIPSETDRNQLAELAGDTVATLTLSAGAPDSDWTDVAANGLSALALLKTGQLTVSDQTIILIGLAATPQARDMALATVPVLPDGYTFDSQIDVEDDGTPLRLNLSLRDGAIYGDGKLPADLPVSNVTNRFELGEDLSIIEAVVPAAESTWPDAARAGLDALSNLIDAQLNIEGTDMRLAGVGSPDGIAAAQTALAGLPDTYIVVTDLGLWDDGAPLQLRVDWDGMNALATGKYPAGFTPTLLVDVAIVDDGRNRFLADETGAFTANANAGLTALGALLSGALIVTETEITLTGTATSPQVETLIDDALSMTSADTEITVNLSYLDDGSPAAWSLSYDAADGGAINGRLPNGLDVATIADALGLAQLSGAPGTAFEDDALGSSLDSLQIVAAYLPEVETLTYSHDSDGSALDLVVTPGVSIDLVVGDLAERLPVDVAFSLSALDVMPDQATARTNAATRTIEVFMNGFWLPAAAFIADADECDAQSLNILDRAPIGFLPSSATFDATSIRPINALAAVALACVDAGLVFEIGGHTDATGSALANEVLSANRANSVRAALIERGVPADAMTAFGYGQTQPVADNGTPEGRAANRRTDITWFAVDAAVNP